MCVLSACLFARSSPARWLTSAFSRILLLLPIRQLFMDEPLQASLRPRTRCPFPLSNHSPSTVALHSHQAPSSQESLYPKSNPFSFSFAVFSFIYAFKPATALRTYSICRLLSFFPPSPFSHLFLLVFRVWVHRGIIRASFQPHVRTYSVIFSPSCSINLNCSSNSHYHVAIHTYLFDVHVPSPRHIVSLVVVVVAHSSTNTNVSCSNAVEGCLMAIDH